jgi:hypothetical protein
MTEAQQRFLRAVAGRVAPERIVEVRLFPALRRGPFESGVAVIAAEALPVPMEQEVALTATPADLAAEAQRGALIPRPEAPLHDPDALASSSTLVPRPSSSSPRLSILTARYRLTLKGPERGKWEFDMVHDADAPLETLEGVVRGVAGRLGEEGEPDLLSGEAFHRAISEPWWSTSP